MQLAETPAPQLVGGSIVALGAVVPNDGRVSWLSAGASGYAPIQCFLLREAESALLFDTGVPAHEHAVVSQLARALDEQELSIVLSRAVEFDSIGNCEAIIRSRTVRRVYAHFAVDGWLSFQPRFDRDASEAHADIEFEILRPGTVLHLRQNGGRPVEFIQTPLRLLGTVWLYDHETRVLFSSDAFGHVPLATPGDDRAVDAGSDRTTARVVRDHLFTKFDWLLRANTSTISAELADIFVARTIDAIAPAHGRIICGRDLVKRHHEMVQHALLGQGA